MITISGSFSLKIPGIEVPKIPLSVPEAELNAAGNVWNNLVQLEEYLGLFKRCVELADIAEGKVETRSQSQKLEDTFPSCEFYEYIERWRAFTMIAARDGALQIAHFEAALKAINFKGCPSWQSIANQSQIRAARRRFDEEFPTFRDSRDVVAHLGDFSKDEKKLERHSARDGFEGTGINNAASARVVLRNHLSGRFYTNTFEGKVVTYEISNGTFERLKKITSQVFSAFNHHT